MRTAALIRTYNNPNTLPLLRQVLDFVDCVVLVVNAREDNNITPQLIKELRPDQTQRVFIQNLEHYSWSIGLNEGLRFLASYWHPVANDDFVLSISNEVEITKKHFDTLIQTILKDEYIAGVGPAFNGPAGGRSYQVVRNTCALWRLFTLLTFGGFSTKTDRQAGQNGMEDLEISLRLARHNFQVVRLENLAVPLKVRNLHGQQEKEQREQETMDFIQEWYKEN